MLNLKNLKIAVKLGILVIVMLVGFVVVYGLSMVGMDRVRVNGPIYNEIKDGKDLIADILPPPAYIIESYLTSLQMLHIIQSGGQASEITALEAKIDQLKQDFETRHAYWLTVLDAGEMKQDFSVVSYEAAQAFFASLESEYLPLIKARDVAGASSLFDEVLTPVYLEHRAAIDNVAVLAADANAALEISAANEVNNMRILLGVIALVVSAVGLLISVLIGRGIVNPVKQIVSVANRVAQGDVSGTVTLESKDEIGELAEAFRSIMRYLQEMAGVASRIAANDLTASANPKSKADVLGNSFRAMIENLRRMVGQLQSVVDTLATASQGLAEKAGAVAQAAEEMSMNTVSVASGIDQTTSSLRNVAAATEEMTATISDVASHSEQARRITEQAVTQTKDMHALIQELGSSAQEIGKVTETITAISDQTRLLALNATIEAARAGANGKGFAVVANEIKALAQQVALATTEIKTMVTSVQSSTGSAVVDIEKINTIIREARDYVAMIAAAIEEQSVVTRDIAANISQASQGVEESNNRVGEISALAQGVAEDITSVSTDGGAAGSRRSSSAAGLSRLAEELRGFVSQFQL